MHRIFTRIIFLFVSVLLLQINPINAQVYTGADAQEKLDGTELIRLNPDNGLIQYAILNNDNTFITELQTIDYLKKVYKLSNQYGFKVLNESIDELGFTHIRYQLNYQTISVKGAIIIAHFKTGYLHSFNGSVFYITELKSNILLPESKCLQIALDSVGAKSYLWEFPEEEEAIKEIKQDINATWYPKAELMYVPNQLDFKRSFHLVYRYNIHASNPRTAENIYISVIDGRLIARENELHTTDVPGKANTKYSGTQNIITDSTAPFNYRLRENTRGNGIYTFNMKKGTNYGAAVDFLDSNNIWNNINANKDEIATDAHWGAETTYDYFKSKFNRNSYNNANARINSYVHYANNYDNAFWDGLRMTYGDGNNFKPLTSLDVCGHEIAHAVTTYTAGLIYRNESGQLNESFSDIFGNSVERYGKPNSYDWKIGEEITNNGSGLRNMSDPRLKGHPRCYKGTNWYYGTGDNGGVHLNSGVQNWWYYLITEGGSGSNDFSNAFTVDSLGMLKAEQIAYRNLTVYLTPNSNYSDARFYSIRSAIDLYGLCSKEVIAVTNAWYACNVGPEYDSGYVKADFSADTVICSVTNTVKFNNLSTNAASYQWYFGDGNGASTYNPTHIYSTYGNYTIKLVVTSCFKNNKDSIVKTSYVKLDSTLDICNAVLMPLTGDDSTHLCASFVYDDGGEDIYRQLRKTNLRISTPGADSIRIKFYDFDYELNYDSLYIYKGKYPGGVKIGGYTGSTLPNGGNDIVVTGSMVTLRHISDPYVVGRGFKLYYESFKKAVKVTAFSDTSICYGNATLLYAMGQGGYIDDYRFKWENHGTNDSIIVNPLTTTQYKVHLIDVCSKTDDSATVTVDVYAPLKLTLNKDTIVCSGAPTLLSALGSGGKTSAYQFTWDNGLGNGSSKNVNPLTSTTYRVILSDGCTPISDTAYVNVIVKDPLKVNISSIDTIVCFNKSGILNAAGSGGDTMNYNYNWDNGLGNGSQVFFNFISSALVKVTLSDACSSVPATDSIYILVRPELKIQINKDSTICKGSSAKLEVIATGGDSNNYSYIWSPSLADTSIQTVNPVITTVYYVTLKDQCSDDVKDSVLVTVLPALQVSGLKDTTICKGMSVPLIPIVVGGRSSTYTFTWNLGLGSGTTQLVTPNGSSTYQVIVNDGCTLLGDTATANITVKAGLKAILSSNDTLICYNKNSDISVSGTGGISTKYVYNWSHGLGTGTNKSIILKNDAWIKVSLEDACTVIPAVDSIFIQVRPEMNVSLPKDSLICYGGSVKLDAVGVGGNAGQYNFIWNQSLPALGSQIVKPLAFTTYIVTLKDACSDDASDTINIDVLPALKISGIKDTTICYGGIVNFNPTVSGGVMSQYQYNWNKGLGNAKNQSVSPLSSISYKLIVDDQCSFPYDSATVTVTVRPALNIKTSLSKNSLCQGDSSLLELQFSGGLPSAYQWTINGLNSSNLFEWLIPSNSMHYNIQLIDNCSLPIEDSVYINVNPQPIPDFTSNLQEVCVNQLVLFQNTSTGAATYRWELNPQDSTVKTKSPSYRYGSSGNYNIKLTAITDSLCVAVLIKNGFIDVVDLPISNFNFSPQNPDYFNRKVTFNNLSKNDVQFEWDFGDLYKETVLYSPQHEYADTGHFVVRLISSNRIGCQDTMFRLLHVKDVFRIFVPNAITVNDDYLNDSLIVVGRGIVSYDLKIFNRWGELVYQGNMGDLPFNGRDKNGNPLMQGSYLINLSARDFEGFEHFVRHVLEIL